MYQDKEEKMKIIIGHTKCDGIEVPSKSNIILSISDDEGNLKVGLALSQNSFYEMVKGYADKLDKEDINSQGKKESEK